MPVIRQALVLLLTAAFARGASQTEAGIAAFREGRYVAAAQALEGASDVRGRLFYGLTLAAQGDCAKALPLLGKVSDADASVRRLAGIASVRCLSNSGETLAAATALQRLESAYPNDPDVLYLSAKLHMKAFNDATLQMFQRSPASYRVHQLSAEIFEVQNRYDEAAREYRRAIELNPKAPDLHFRLGRAILLQSHEQGALDQAAEQFRAELALSPEDSATEFQLAQIALVKGDSGEADLRLERAIRLSPTYVAALIALGKLRSHEKKFPAAIALLTQAARLQPANEGAHYALMAAYRDNGQMQEAKAEKATLDKLQKPPQGEFSEFLKKLGEKPPAQ